MAEATSFGAFPKGDGRLPSGLVPASAAHCAGGQPVSVKAMSGKTNVAAESSCCCFADMSFSSERSSFSDYTFAPEELSFLENFLCGSGDGTVTAHLGANSNVAGTALASYGEGQGCLTAQAQAQPFNSPAAASPMLFHDLLGLPSLEIRPTGMLATAPSFGQASMVSSHVMAPSEQQQLLQRRPSSVVPWQQQTPIPPPQPPSLLFKEGSALVPEGPASAAAPPPVVPWPWPWGQSLSLELPQTQTQQQQQLLQPQHQQQRQPPPVMQFLSFSADAQMPQGLANWQPDGAGRGAGDNLALDERLLAEIEAAPWPDFLPPLTSRSSFNYQAQLQQQPHQSPPPPQTQTQLQGQAATQSSSVPGNLPAAVAVAGAAAGAAAADGMTICGQGTFAPSSIIVPNRHQPNQAMAELMLCRQFECAMTDVAETPEPPPRHPAVPPVTAAAAPLPPPSVMQAAGVSAAARAGVAAATAALGFGGTGGDGSQVNRLPSSILAVSMNVVADAAAAAMPLGRGSGAIAAAAAHRASNPCGVQQAAAPAAANYHSDMAAVPKAPATGGAGAGPVSAVPSGDGTGTAASTDDTDDGCEAETGASSGDGRAAAAAADAPAAPAKAAAATAAAAKVQRNALTLETLRSMFELPSQDVVRALGISATDLKRRCRALGIRRWPHRKLASLQRLAQAVDADADLPLHEREAVLESVATNRSQIFRDPNADLAPNLKVLRQVQYKRHFMEKRGSGH